MSAQSAAPKFRILKVYHTPGQDVVTIALMAIDGAFRGQIKDVYTTQKALTDRIVERRRAELESASKDVSGLDLVNQLNWGDQDTIEEAVQLAAAFGGEILTEPEKAPTPVVDSPPQPPAPLALPDPAGL
jgi:hypothetical protein